MNGCPFDEPNCFNPVLSIWEKEIDQKVIWLKAYCLYIADTLAFNAMVDLRNSQEVRDTFRLINEVGIIFYRSKPNYQKRRVLSFESWREYHSIYES